MEVLEARNREQSAGYNELALSLMDVLGAVAHGGCLSAQHHVASLFRLVLALGKLLRHRQPPLRLRAAAADLLAKLAASKQLSAVMLPCLGARIYICPSCWLCCCHTHVPTLPSPLGIMNSIMLASA